MTFGADDVQSTELGDLATFLGHPIAFGNLFGQFFPHQNPEITVDFDELHEEVRNIKTRLLIYDIVFFVTFAVIITESLTHYFF